MSKPVKHPTVAVYLTHAITASGRLQREIARDLGYDHSNVVTMIKQGRTKLPLNKVGPMAKALDVDPAELLRLAMIEYMPDTWEAIKDNIGLAFLTEDEREVLETYRGLLIVVISMKVVHPDQTRDADWCQPINVIGEARMNIHENARTTPVSRALLVRRVRGLGWRVSQAASAAGISRRTAYKWLRRFANEGQAGLRDRSSCPQRRQHALPREWCDLVVYLRGFDQPARQIGRALGLARSTVSAVLSRHGLGARAALEPPRPPCRYERRHAGELLHLDIKKLGRFSRPGHRVTGSRLRRSSSHERARVLPRWLRYYNEHRAHASLNYLPPISRRPTLCEQRS